MREAVSDYLAIGWGWVRPADIRRARVGLGSGREPQPIGDERRGGDGVGVCDLDYNMEKCKRVGCSEADTVMMHTVIGRGPVVVTLVVAMARDKTSIFMTVLGPAYRSMLRGGGSVLVMDGAVAQHPHYRLDARCGHEEQKTEGDQSSHARWSKGEAIPEDRSKSGCPVASATRQSVRHHGPARRGGRGPGGADSLLVSSAPRGAAIRQLRQQISVRVGTALITLRSCTGVTSGQSSNERCSC